MLPLAEKSRSDLDGKATFADDRTRALLAGRIEELSRPQQPQWLSVKQNASRTVYRGAAAGQEVYLKHYHPRSLWKRLARSVGRSQARKEMDFALYLAGRGVPTPAPLAAMCSGRTEWLATLAVRPAEQADLWHLRNLARGPEGRREIRKAIVDLACTIAAMHNAGVLHGDLHAGNVLIRTDGPQPECVLTDLHRMTRRRRLSRRARAANLAGLTHDRFDYTTRSERLLFLRHYLAASGQEGSLHAWQEMIFQFAMRHRRRHCARRDRRVMGNNRHFSRVKLSGGWSGHVMLAGKRLARSAGTAGLQFSLADWEAALSDPRLLIEGDAVKVVKDSPSGKVVLRKLKVGPHELNVMVKQPRRKRRWKALVDCLRPARPISAFRTGHNLLTRGIATVVPLAAMERRVGPLLLDSMLITEAHDARHLDQFLNDWLASQPASTKPAGPDKPCHPLSSRQRLQLARQVLWQMGRLLQKLHENNYRHRDMKCPNMLVDWPGEGRPEILLVDMDGLRRVRWLTLRQRYQNLMRLNVSLLRCPAVNHTGQLRMLLGYLRGTTAGRIHFKPYWRTLEEWSARKLQRQIRSRQRKQRAARG